MKLHSKKILAREILILISIIFIGFLIYLAIYFNNSYHSYRMANISETLQRKTKLRDSLEFDFKEKYEVKKWFYQEFTRKYEVGLDKRFINLNTTWTHFYNMAITDSIEYKWNNIWDQDFRSFFVENGFCRSPEECKDFFKYAYITKIDIDNWNLSQKIQKELELLKEASDSQSTKRISPEERYSIISKYLFWLMIILFPVRYLYYLIKWSIKTLKE